MGYSSFVLRCIYIAFGWYTLHILCARAHVTFTQGEDQLFISFFDMNDISSLCNALFSAAHLTLVVLTKDVSSSHAYECVILMSRL